MKWRQIKQQSTKSPKQGTKAPVIYAGFWSRALAFVIDIFMIGLPISIVIMMVFGYDTLHTPGAMDVLTQGTKDLPPPSPIPAIVQMSLALIVYVTMWYKLNGQTPGKKFARIKVVDARTLEGASLIKLTVRFFAYFFSFVSIVGFLLPLLLPNKQALHDIFASTAVIYEPTA